jgi:hypothetical protein
VQSGLKNLFLEIEVGKTTSWWPQWQKREFKKKNILKI